MGTLMMFGFFFLMQCTFSATGNRDSEETSESVIDYKETLQKKAYPILDSTKTIKIAGHLVDIISPSGEIKGNIIALPGWSFPRADWCEKSSLCKKALAQGYRLILPEIGKGMYTSEFYPETVKEWQSYPDKNWVIKEMIPSLQQQYGVLLKEQNNFILGLSTGARGVAIVCLAEPDLFLGAAALSGDYEQTQIPNDNLITGFYGSYYRFPERWKGIDNPGLQAHLFKTPFYLGHGKQDPVCTYQQTVTFYELLKKNNPQLKTKLNLVDAVHDYKYWDSEVENMLQFFEEQMQK